MNISARRPCHRARTLFLSDIHLGFKHSRVRELADFLQSIEAECIVLAGDIVDGLSLARRFFWNADHERVLNLLRVRQRAGTRLVYLPGNHDALDSGLKVLSKTLGDGLEVHRQWVHNTARGQRILVVHGDQFDTHIACSTWLNWLGLTLYDFFVAVNYHLNDLLRLIGRPYWPLVERLKLAIARSARYVTHFEHVAAKHARELGFDGIICGHIHRANLRHIDGLLYCNTGDWVESCSALIEDMSGELQMWRWPHGAREMVPLQSGLVAGPA